MSLDSRVVIITGGARGIGYACARRFLEDGHKVVIADRDADAAARALNNLSAFEDRVSSIACDVSERLAVKNLMAETLSRFGEIDVLVNNAALAPSGGMLDLSMKDFTTVMNTNLRGAFLTSQAAAKQMIIQIDDSEDRSRADRERYAIINITSVNGQVATPDFFALTVSKGGLNQMTKAMAVELAPYGIRVNAVGPGSIKTDMLGGAAENERARQTILSRTPLGRIGTGEDISGVVAFLASRDARYMTGEIIYVDGGRLALNYIMPGRDDAAGTE